MLRVNNLIGFGGAVAAGPVTFVADDGDDTVVGAGSTTIAFGANTATGPYVLAGLSWNRNTNAARTLSSLAWNGVNGTILVQHDFVGASDDFGAAIVLFEGSQSGNLTATFDATIDDAAVSKLSISGLSSTTPIDTDSDDGGAGTVSMSYATPTADGIAVYVYAATVDTNAVTPGAGFTEISDIDTTNYRHSMAYRLGASTSAAPDNAGGSNDEVGVVVSMR
jgi:hypothetical protein